MATQRNSLADTIEKDFLACAICFEQLTDPVGLPCLHAFCFECLDNWHKTSLDKAVVVCPACKATTCVPTAGIRGFPGHFLIKNLRETIKMEKQKSPVKLAVGDTVRVKSTKRQGEEQAMWVNVQAPQQFGRGRGRAYNASSDRISGVDYHFGTGKQVQIKKSVASAEFDIATWLKIYKPSTDVTRGGALGNWANPRGKNQTSTDMEWEGARGNEANPRETNQTWTDVLEGSGANPTQYEGTIADITGAACTVLIPGQAAWNGPMSDLQLVRHCDVCGHKNDATVHCLDCKNNFCDTCNTSHKTFPAMKDHMAVPIQDLNTGKDTYADRFCQLHGERVRYYCETEQKQVCPDCVGLKTCAVEHERVSMKDAAKKQSTKMKALIQQCESVNSKVQNAVKDTRKVQQDLNKAEQEAKAALAKVKKDYIAQVDALIRAQEKQISQLVRTRNRELQININMLLKKSRYILMDCRRGCELTQPGKEFEITHSYPAVAKCLEEYSKKQFKICAADKSLSKLKFEAIIPTVSSIGTLHT